MRQALSRRLAHAALQRLPKALKISQAVVSFAPVPFLLTVQSEPGLGSVSGLLSGCLLERQRPVPVVGKAGYMYL